MLTVAEIESAKPLFRLLFWVLKRLLHGKQQPKTRTQLKLLEKSRPVPP